MTFGTHRPRVALVIEDDAPLRGLLAELLTEAGYDVLQAPDGAVGLRLAQEHQPHVILLDLALPPASGRDVLDRLRARESTRYIPVVVITGQHPSALAAMAPQPDSLIQKPFDIGLLLAHLDRMAALREARGVTPTRQG